MIRTLFILNPNAGKMQAKHNLFKLIDLFTKNKYEVTVFPTQDRLDATNIVKEKANEYDLIVCSGGDGTLNEVISGLMHHTNRPKLGYIPTGTTNDLATSLNLPKTCIKAAKKIIAGSSYYYDIGSLNDSYFTYIAAFGAFTKVSYTTSQKFKNALGRISYFLEGIKHLTEIKTYPIKIEYDHGVIEDDFVFGAVTNSTSIAGLFHLNSHDVILNDGLFEVLLIKSPKNAIELKNIIMGLLKQQYNDKYVTFFQASHLKITSDSNIPWIIDGENGGTQRDVTISNNHKGIEFIL
ncbi:YegS/Rv2252/BmrU family lipid kinase [Natranaerovirga pectinivora]|uniref:YegS/Rv2252/BmrU family lipid kinase n=1 Tax=Natranaerovirga pectinivora TaxID=682400 RepID=A0A4R3MNP0_9FIRM|nr:YegS/Rv2252/BmrU family lipid kinase [Natranaerovirga pectinivora]TCT16140.1 YegS/Rv2252/BmrU family lipid kinase [Natranaerovirga pectinivora]